MNAEILKQVPRIRPATPEDVERIARAASADGCGSLFPTHSIDKQGECVGFLSLGVVPMVGLWVHSTKFHPRDTLNMVAFIDDAMNARGLGTYAIPLHKGSKFSQYLEPLGCIRGGEFEMFYKTSTK